MVTLTRSRSICVLNEPTRNTHTYTHDAKYVIDLFYGSAKSIMMLAIKPRKVGVDWRRVYFSKQDTIADSKSFWHATIA